MKKSKKLALILLPVTFVLVLILGLGLSIPGLGLSTQKFINSFKAEIKKDLPPGKVVIWGENNGTHGYLGTHINPNTTIEDSLKYAYENDVLSTLTKNQFNDNNLKNKYISEADTAFYNNLKTVQDSNGNVDMYNFSMKLLDFDESVAKSNGFGTNAITGYGFVSTGLSWFSHSGISELFNKNKSDTYKLATQYSVKSNENDQMTYDQDFSTSQQNNVAIPNNLQYGEQYYDILQNPNLINVSNDISIVKNKVWFFNEQLRLLRLASTLNVFVDPTQINKLAPIPEMITSQGQMLMDVKLNNPLEPTDLFQPNYLSAFTLAQVGASILVIIVPLLIISEGLALGYIFRENIFKNNKIIKQENNIQVK